MPRRLSAMRLPVVPLRTRFVDTPGQPDAANAAGIVEAIDRAVDDCLRGPRRGGRHLPDRQEGRSTMPASLSRPYRISRASGGGAAPASAVTPVMMLAGPELRTVPVTIHIPLAEVPAR